jgi:chromosome segregation ATPase
MMRFVAPVESELRAAREELTRLREREQIIEKVQATWEKDLDDARNERKVYWAAIHAFAHKTGALPGNNVLDHLDCAATQLIDARRQLAEAREEIGRLQQVTNDARTALGESRIQVASATSAGKDMLMKIARLKDENELLGQKYAQKVETECALRAQLSAREPSAPVVDEAMATVEFVEEWSGAQVATIYNDNEQTIVEVQRQYDDKFDLIIHNTNDKGERSDMTATLERKHFAMLGSIALTAALTRTDTGGGE